MKNKSVYIFVVGGLALTVIGWNIWKSKQRQEVITETVITEVGDIHVSISTTGTVQPQNRLEMKPPISGRIEEILVREGDKVKSGQIVARMSSIERATLLDAARAKGQESVAYWNEAYKATPLIAPIDGTVIVRAVEPGQTVTASDPVLVISDRLIVKGQVDETDIGRIQIGQKARISLDAYPEQKIEGTVDHISYESELINNVTIYEVDVVPTEVPDIFRSGMTANLEVVIRTAKDVVRLPVRAVKRSRDKETVLIHNGKRPPVERPVKTGLANDRFIEITEGLSEGETVVIEKGPASLPRKRSGGGSPFMPTGGGRNR